MSSISEQIINDKNLATVTAQTTSAQTTKTSTSVSSSDFLNLLCMQLQYQDPTNPTDNSEMLAQEAQFVSLEAMENLSSSFAQFSNVYQANSLMGQVVEVSVDDNTVVGTVDYVDFSDKSGASISVGGNMYPLSSVTKVFPESSFTPDNDNSVLDSIQDALGKIANNISNIANKVLGNNEQNNDDIQEQ